jgi:hypothetical protein
MVALAANDPHWRGWRELEGKPVLTCLGGGERLVALFEAGVLRLLCGHPGLQFRQLPASALAALELPEQREGDEREDDVRQPTADHWAVSASGW